MMRWWPLITALVISGYACASSQGNSLQVSADPYRLTPLEGAIVIELDVPNWTELCVRQGPAQTHIYNCLPVGALRASLEQHRNASGRSWPVGKIRALLGF
jgi:hypothetical protein